MRSAAWIISRIFDPVVVVPVIIFGVVSLAFVNGFNWQVMVTLLLLDAVLPGSYVVVRYVRNKGKDWDIRSREERLPLFALTVAAHLLGVLYVYWLGLESLALVLFCLWLLAVVYAMVTMFWKISIHAGVNSTLATLVFLFGFELWWVWLIPVVVGWARIVERHHTWQQVVVGSFVPPVLLSGLFRIFGL